MRIPSPSSLWHYLFQHQQGDDLRDRDVFGRTGSLGESFANWSRYIAIIRASGGFLTSSTACANYGPCRLRPGPGKHIEASIIPAIITAIQDRDKVNLNAILAVAATQDWDAICPSVSAFGDHHNHANLIRRWLAAVTNDVTPHWVEGIATF